MIESQHQETHKRSASTPFVTNLFPIAQTAVAALYVVVGANPFRSRASQEGDHLAKLAIVEHLQGCFQFRHRQEPFLTLQCPQTAPRLVFALVLDKKSMQGIRELAQGPQLREILQHSLEVLPLLLGHVRATLNNQKAALEHEFRLLLLGLVLFVTPPLLRLGWSATAAFTATIATPRLTAAP